MLKPDLTYLYYTGREQLSNSSTTPIMMCPLTLAVTVSGHPHPWKDIVTYHLLMR